GPLADDERGLGAAARVSAAVLALRTVAGLVREVPPSGTGAPPSPAAVRPARRGLVPAHGTLADPGRQGGSEAELTFCRSRSSRYEPGPARTHRAGAPGRRRL